jgi:putative ubiquitin-RnfH superfamily antitoxin RatB of RatAB toxin-antitoxin module
MADGAASLRVTVAYSPGPRQVDLWDLTLPAGATVADALAGSGLFEAHPALRGQPLALAVWGRNATLSQVVRERDRVEVLRPLLVDPKVARRERFVKQGSRGTGLFAKKPRAR